MRYARVSLSIADRIEAVDLFSPVMSSEQGGFSIYIHVFVDREENGIVMKQSRRRRKESTDRCEG